MPASHCLFATCHVPCTGSSFTRRVELGCVRKAALTHHTKARMLGKMRGPGPLAHTLTPTLRCMSCHRLWVCVTPVSTRPRRTTSAWTTVTTWSPTTTRSSTVSDNRTQRTTPHLRPGRQELYCPSEASHLSLCCTLGSSSTSTLCRTFFMQAHKGPPTCAHA